MIDFAADMTTLFSDFSVAATLSGAAVTGIFDETGGAVMGLVGGYGLAFLLPATAIDSDPRGETLVIGAASYTVVDWTVAEGVATLKLESA